MGLFGKLFGNSNDCGMDGKQINKGTFDPNTDYAIYDIVMALSYLATEANDSWVIVALQDEKPEKGWGRHMSVSATIDNWLLENRGVTELKDAQSFRKLGMPEDIVNILASTPFTGENGNLEFVITNMVEYPSTCAQAVLNSMREGSSRSKYYPMRTVKITDNHGVLECKVD